MPIYKISGVIDRINFFQLFRHIPGSLGIKIRNCLSFKHYFQKIAIVHFQFRFSTRNKQTIYLQKEKPFIFSIWLPSHQIVSFFKIYQLELELVQNLLRYRGFFSIIWKTKWIELYTICFERPKQRTIQFCLVKIMTALLRYYICPQSNPILST